MMDFEVVTKSIILLTSVKMILHSLQTLQWQWPWKIYSYIWTQPQQCKPPIDSLQTTLFISTVKQISNL